MDYSQYPKLELRRKFWKILGAEINITEPSSGQVVGFIKMKAWKLREDIRLFSDNTQQQEVFRIKARQIIDFGATYDVFDSATDQLIFSLRRKGLRSTFLRDHWDILDAAGSNFGAIEETSGFLALARRWLSAINDLIGLIFAFAPQTYEITKLNSGIPAVAARIVHQKNPLVVKMSLDTSGVEVQIDPRISVASAAMLSIIDANKG